VSKDAELAETAVKVTMGGEFFNAKGTIVEVQNWLEIFYWEKLTDNELPMFIEG
jgi:DNA topoisomerase IA